MPLKTTSLSLILLAALAAPAMAQDAAAGDAAPDARTPAEDAAAAPEETAGGTTEETAPAEGPRPYIAETFGDWQLRCIENPQGEDPCQLFQLISDPNGGALAEFTLNVLPNGNAGVSLLTPLETLLTENVRLTVDGGQPKVYPFTFCTSIGCISRIGLTPDDIAAYKAGNQVTMRIVPVRAADQEVTAPVSLTGFTAGFDALAARQ